MFRRVLNMPLKGTNTQVIDFVLAYDLAIACVVDFK